MKRTPSGRDPIPRRAIRHSIFGRVFGILAILFVCPYAANVAEDFEGDAIWKVYFKTNLAVAGAECEAAAAHTGERGARLRLAGVKAGASLQFGPRSPIALGELPKQFSLWVFGDASNQGVSFLAQFGDANGETHQYALGRVLGAGWMKLSATLRPAGRTAWGGDSNWEAEAPVSLKCLVAAFPQGAPAVELRLDELAAEEGAATATPPVASASNSFPMTAAEWFPSFKEGDRALGEDLERRVWDSALAEQASNEFRGRICLNGLWHFIPGHTNARPPAPGSGWGWLKVPGGWPTSHRWGMNPWAFLPMGTAEWDRLFGVPETTRTNWWFGNEKRGAFIPWDGIRRAWYERTFTIPADWAGRKILLIVKNPEQQAHAWVNGRSAGKLAWPGGALDVSGLARAGASNHIALHVTSSARVELRGLAGDLFLESEGTGPKIEEAACEASMEGGAPLLHVWVRGGAGVGPADAVAVKVLDLEEDRVVRAFAPLPLSTAGATNARGSVRLSLPWPEGERWSFDRPRRYRHTLALLRAGRAIDRTLPAAFGMRAFAVDGKVCRLNGNRIAFRTAYYRGNLSSFAHCDRASIERLFQAYRSVGINLVSPANYSVGPGGIFYMEDFFEAADRMGMGVLLQLPRWADFDREGRDKASARAEWERAVSALVDDFGRRHPSILLYGFNQSLYHYVDEGNPLSQGSDWDPTAFYRTARPSDYHAFIKPWASNLAWTGAFLEAIKPGAVAVNIGDGAFPGAATTSIYLYMNSVPAAELRHWFDRFESNAVKPLFVSEWGAPATASFTLYRRNNPHPYPAASRIGPEPVPVEVLAGCMGEAAWVGDEPYRAYARHVDSLYARGTNFHLHEVMRDAPGADAFYRPVQARQLEAVVPVWRYAGLSQIVPYEGEALEVEATLAGVPPTGETNWPLLQRPGLFPDARVNAWRFKPTPLAETYRRVFMPVCAAWGGKDTDLYADERQYRVGETIEKCLLLTSDACGPRALSIRVRLDASAVPVLETRRTLAPGERVKIPFRFAIAKPGAAVLSAELAVDGDRDQPRAWLPEITLFVHEGRQGNPAATAGACALWDPKGRSREALRAASIPFTEIRSPALAIPGACLCVGSRALDSISAEDRRALENFRGTLLVLEQDVGALWDQLALRSFPHGFREAYPARVPPWSSGAMPAACWVGWRGNSTLVEPYQRTHAEHVFEKLPEAWLGQAVRMPWKWGNGQTVGSVALERPPLGRWRSWVHCGFDLQYSLVLEGFAPGQRVILCQADVSSRTEEDPAAGALLRALVAEAAKGAAKGAVPQLIGKNGADWVEILGDFARRPSLSNDPGAPLLVLPGADGEMLARARGRAEQGARVVALALSQEELESMLPGLLTVQTRAFLALDGKASLETMDARRAPLGLGDFALRSEIASAEVQSCRIPGAWFVSPGVYGLIPLGKGSITLFLPDPRKLKPDAMAPHKRFSWFKLTRAIHTLLANEGFEPAGQTGLWRSGTSDNPNYLNVASAADQFYRWQWW